MVRRAGWTNNSVMDKLQTLQVAHSLRQAADEILAEAGVALEGLNAEKPSVAVHGYRVALKRWRALLRYCTARSVTRSSLSGEKRGCSAGNLAAAVTLRLLSTR
jgi:hypothetical protein